MLVWQGLILQKKGNFFKDLFVGFFFIFQVESLDECWIFGFRFVDWIFIDVFSVLFVDWDGFDKDDRYCRR